MPRSFLSTLLAAAAWLLAAAPTGVHAQTVYATADNGATDLFGTLNLATGQFTQIAAGTTFFYGLTLGGNGTLYGSDYTGALYTLSPTGTATRYGTTALPSGNTNGGLAATGSGFLADADNGSTISLYRISADGNSTSTVGTLQTGNHNGPSGSLAFGPGGTLFFDENPSGNAASPATLFTVNPATGAKTAVGTQLGTVILTLVSTATTLYGIDAVDTSNIGIYKIDTGTGLATQVATVTGLPAGYTLDTAVVPEPSTWACLGLGVAGLGVAALRRRTRAA